MKSTKFAGKLMSVLLGLAMTTAMVPAIAFADGEPETPSTTETEESVGTQPGQGDEGGNEPGSENEDDGDAQPGQGDGDDNTSDPKTVGNVTWSISESALTIKKTENADSSTMPDFNDPAQSDESIAPWYSSESSITSIKIEEGVTSIGDYAFAGCASATSATIPTGVTSIGEGAFKGCAKITALDIPSSVATIKKDAFVGCTTLKTINYIGTLEKWNQSISNDFTNAVTAKIVCKETQEATNGVTAYAVAFDPNGGTGTMKTTFVAATTPSTEEPGGTPGDSEESGDTEDGTDVQNDTNESTDDTNSTEGSGNTPSNPDEGTDTPSDTEEETNAFTLPTCTFTAPLGKQFAGWATAADGNIIEDDTIAITQSTTLYAIWKNRTPSAHTHNWGEWIITKDPTCTDEGERSHTCSTCGNVATEAIPATGHEAVHVAAVAPTETTAGNIEHWRCEACNKLFSDAGLTNEVTSEQVRIAPTGDNTPDVPNPDNPAANEWKGAGNSWWYRHADGSYTTNAWELISGTWYHFDEAGWMQSGWQAIDGKWYFLNDQHDGAFGAMQTGWILDGYWYYCDASGAMLTGWQFINGNWYLLCTYANGSLGSMYQNGTWTTNGGTWTFDASGAWVR